MKIFKKKKAQNTADYFVQWHLLDHCNLHCAHCYQPDAALNKISYSDALTVLSRLDDFFKGTDYTPQINLTGGEPLLYDRLLDLIDEIVKRGWKWALLTNGILLDEARIAQLKERKPVFIQVSLEGDEEKNNQCRGQGTFQKICHAMDLLVAARLKCLVSFTITSHNWQEYPKVAAICQEHKVHKLWCDRYVGKDEQAISTEDFRSFLELMKYQREHNHSSTILAAERALMFQIGGNSYHCNAGGTLLVILPDGTLLPCRRLELPLGNVLAEPSIQQILDKSQVWATLQKKLYASDCIKCPDLNHCQGGAKCITYAQTGKIFGKDVNC